jgi:hypothetical protein
MSFKVITPLKLAFVAAIFFSAGGISACRQSQAEHIGTTTAPEQTIRPSIQDEEPDKEPNQTGHSRIQEADISATNQKREANEPNLVPTLSQSQPTKSSQEQKIQNELEYMKKLREKTKQLNAFECAVEYLFNQPLLESKTLRKGVLYYRRFGNKSKLRINFNLIQQEDYKEQKYREEYIFDGVWLTQLDYQVKAAKLIQQAEPNEPVDAFDLARRNFPIIGFSSTEDLKKEFEIQLIEEQETGENNFVKFHLVVRPDSLYKDDYTAIDFWIDKKTNLPAKIMAVTTEPADAPIIEKDNYLIKFIKPKVNVEISDKVFEVKIPQSFGQPEVIPFEKSKSS